MVFRLPCLKATSVEVERSEAQRINREAEMSENASFSVGLNVFPQILYWRIFKATWFWKGCALALNIGGHQSLVDVVVNAIPQSSSQMRH